MADETKSLIVPGWYADPLRADGLRWWNGDAWTEHVRDAAPPPPVVQPTYLLPPAQSAQPAAPVQPAYPGEVAYPGQPGYQPQQFVHRPTNNSLAWWSFGLGALSLFLTVSVLIHNSATFIVSTSGILAIINGVRAINHRRQGRATARVLPVLGIVFGSIGTIVMVLSFAAAFLPHATTDPTIGAQPQPGTLNPLGRQPKTPLPDTVLNSYNGVAVTTASAQAVGCRLTDLPLPFPSSTLAKTADRQEQDLMSWDIQPVSQGLVAAKRAAGTWPSLQVDPADGRVFTADCRPIGFIPVGTTLEYAISPDRANAALLIGDATNRLAVLWRSTDNTIYLE
ncbi:DUF2510 domain-containing protein [Diaminobutyricibacter sp. McL0608]|uniref:DUF2510 domain-containing protein n=1 Tax=Leifsonia sp. McL0608 TaxID=3143537 RepID=UPI0031F334C4